MKYRNISDQTQELIGVGIVEAGETIEVAGELGNPNFEVIIESKSKSQEKREKIMREDKE